jgi:DNA-binding response OmpR family regulator
MVTSARGNALVIGNYKGRCDIVRAFRATEFHLSETSECFRGLKHIVDEAPNIVVVHHSRSIADTCKVLRAVRCVTAAPILVVGRGSERSLACALQYGADGYLTRALDPAAFLAYVHALLSKN